MDDKLYKIPSEYLAMVSDTDNYKEDVFNIIQVSKSYVKTHINYAMVYSYWFVGRRIVLQEQNGNSRAEYGKEVIKNLSLYLTAKLGKGFSEQSLYNYRKFYQSFPDPGKFSSAWSILTWSHYKVVMRVESEKAREWYCNESVINQWDIRTLDRNVSTQYFERLLSSGHDVGVVSEMEEKTSVYKDDVLDYLKDPYVLEFLGLRRDVSFKEKQLETAIINSLQDFLLELGKGFSFVDRQKLIRTETQDFYIDLVFYNYNLKCFVLIDLKIGKITHQDIGQMEMYVNMYDDMMKGGEHNPTIGLLLCSETDKTIARYSVLSKAQQIFASKYITYLPTEDELEKEIQRQRRILNL